MSEREASTGVKTVATQQLVTGRPRLPGFSGQWEKKRFGDICTFLSTASNPRADLEGRGDVGYIHYGNVHAHPWPVLDCSCHELPRIEDQRIGNASRLQDGDLVMVDASEDLTGLGKSVEVLGIGSDEIVAGLHTILCRGRSGHWAPGFKSYLQYIPVFRSALTRMATGISVYAISKKQLADIVLALPSSSEQVAIVTVLSDVDKLIESLEALIAKKRAAKTSSMQQLLTGRTRLPGFSDEWETKQLAELGVFSKGRGIKRSDVRDDGCPCIRYGELYTRYSDFVASPVACIPASVALTAQPIENGDLLFAGAGETPDEIGRCAAYVGENTAYAGGDLIILSPFRRVINSLYLGYLLNHPTVSVQKARLAQGDAIVHISSGSLGQVRIELPPVEEQTAIATVLSDMDAEIEA